MKKNTLFFALIIIASFLPVTSQAPFGIEANYGLSGVFQPSINEISHFGGGITYDFDETYGVKLDFASDSFSIENKDTGIETGSKNTRISLQAVMNVSSLINPRSSYGDFRVLAHAGGGYSLVKSTYNAGNDNLVNVVMGLTPRFKITDGLYFAVDASTVFNISQHYNFDGSFSYQDNINSFTGITYNLTGGIIYKFNEY